MKKSLLLSLLAAGMFSTAVFGDAREDRIAEIEAQIRELQAELEELKAESSEEDSGDAYVINASGAVYTYLRHEVKDGKLIVYFNFYNGTDKTRSGGGLGTFRAFQDGMSIPEHLSFTNTIEEIGNAGKQLRPGISIDIATQFDLSNETSPVEVEYGFPWALDEPIDPLVLTLAQE